MFEVTKEEAVDTVMNYIDITRYNSTLLETCFIKFKFTVCLLIQRNARRLPDSGRREKTSSIDMSYCSILGIADDF